ncbi:xylulokinase [Eubacterium aggregans]|uniref:Xylulose kinase n=1 Tax=Eubacterium aggregans TaxID=81409 RepID=A0A1H3ZD04_9FIRM|nr:xylulokinase [Eubacterium aggregans]SEA21656.1 xylulokinase [Eubacterium aggregans]
MKYLLAHDLGTSGNKATLYSTDGQLVGSSVKAYDLHVTNNNWAEQNPNDWWQAVCQSTQELLTDINPADVLGVSFSGQMMGCICVDKGGNPLRNAIIWADMRATREEELIRERISEMDSYKLTGHKISPSYGGQKLMWVKRNQPDIYEKTYKMLNAKDYIILKLTGRFVTEYTDASSTNLLDLNKLEWSDALLNIMEIDADKMPELLRSTDIAGTVTPEAAQFTGLLPGTPVVCGGGDGVCAAVGTGCTREGIAHSCMGTSSWISITTEKPIYDDEMKTFTWAHIVPGYVLPTGTMQCGGGAFNWYKDILCREEEMIAAQEGKSPFELLKEEVASSPVGANGLLFLPYLIGERSPRWNPDAKGAFVGLKMETQKKDMARAVQEGVGMNLNVVLDTFRKNGVTIEDMLVIGGGAQSDGWLQILADIYRMRIQKPNMLEKATSMGAAITAGVGIGVFKNFDVIDQFLKVVDTKVPNEENAKIYDRLKPLFDESYFGLKKVFGALSQFS